MWGKIISRLKKKDRIDSSIINNDIPAVIKRGNTSDKIRDKKNSSFTEKTISRAGEIKEFFGHVIVPEERNIKNYLNISFWKSKRELYGALREKEKQDQNIYQGLSDGASPTPEYYILTVLSCIIATTGLLQGSAATIIGAMIVAPLMTPILAFSLGIIWGDLQLVKTSAFSLIKGIILSVALSSFIAFIIPMEGYSTEITARTSPTIFDIIVASASGLVGAYGNANKRISNTLVGIAIAVALMPPLCTIGIGIGSNNISIASGASLLFLINLVSISLAGAIVFWYMKIHPLSVPLDAVRKRAISQIVVSIIILSAIALPVGIYMKNGYLHSRANRITAELIRSELPELSLIEFQSIIKNGKYHFTITLSGTEMPDRIKADTILKKAIAKVKNIGGIKFIFVQSTEINGNIPEAAE